jgi:hypothetical protein
MATARLTDSQKQELVQRFRQGESTQALADHFGCSTTTVTRLVRSEMDPKDYAALRDQRQKRGHGQLPLTMESSTTEEQVEPDHTPVAVETDHASVAAAPPQRPPALADGLQDQAAPAVDEDVIPEEEADEDTLAPPEANTPHTTVLAIDDADDFGDDEEEDTEEDLLVSDEEGEEDSIRDAGDFHTVAVLPISVDDQRETRPAPWSPALLPSCAYLLVDKTVELQARPLGEMPELGILPSEEMDRQALVLFTNPRQAKRHCGRTQRVIKLPDPALLGRTAPYLLAQGISRVVIEGALYALPDHQ